MLFTNPNKKIKSGDFVIGARTYGQGRLFSTPCIVIETEGTRALVVVESDAVWFGMEQLELVVLNERPENE